mgnify:CR=1 FL=1
MMGFRLLFAPAPPAAFPFDRLRRGQLSGRPHQDYSSRMREWVKTFSRVRALLRASAYWGRAEGAPADRGLNGLGVSLFR